MLKSTFIFLSIMLFAGALVAAPIQKKLAHKVVSEKYKTDSATIKVHHFDKNALDKYRRDPAFDYAVHEHELNWWDRFWLAVWRVWTAFWDWVARILQKLFGGIGAGKNAISVLRIVIIVMIVALVIYIISKLIGVDLLKLFRKNQPVLEVPYSESLENIHQINFDDSIENALAVKDYRLAVRLLYLRALKQLSDAKLINWQLEKTNSAYLNELKDTEQRQKFSVVTRQFEYVWYGDFPVDGQSFQSINNFFVDFKQTVR
jgi:Domain of unknown function (DUF4129)